MEVIHNFLDVAETTKHWSHDTEHHALQRFTFPAALLAELMDHVCVAETNGGCPMDVGRAGSYYAEVRRASG
jgi:hypothetical protein